jgi:hypothetical protein
MASAPLLATLIYCSVSWFKGVRLQPEPIVYLVILPLMVIWCLVIWHFFGTSLSFVGDWDTGRIILKTYDLGFINTYCEELDVTEVKSIKMQWQSSSGSRGRSVSSSNLVLIKESGEFIELLPYTDGNHPEKEAIVDMTRQYLNSKYERNLR